MELIKELGRRIQKARKKKGLTQQELADLSHVSLKHVQGCERGVKNPSFEVLRAFCKVLNLSLDSLMNLDLPEDEQAANDMRQLYLSCPPAARKVLLNSTRALADELKEMVKTAGIPSAFPSLQFCLNVHQQIDLRRLCLCDCFLSRGMCFLP